MLRGATAKSGRGCVTLAGHSLSTRLVVTLYALLPFLLATPPMGTRRPFGVSVSHLYRHLVTVGPSDSPTDSLIPANRARVARGPVWQKRRKSSLGSMLLWGSERNEKRTDFKICDSPA